MHKTQLVLAAYLHVGTVLGQLDDSRSLVLQRNMFKKREKQSS